MEKENNMDIKEIKNIIEEEGGKVFIAFEGEPSLVIMSLNDYKAIRGDKKQESLKVETPKVPKELESESLNIDDLPF
jgi:PHD/YefM family antitoxin component YafN of YafNO toxin-antitoxin module